MTSKIYLSEQEKGQKNKLESANQIGNYVLIPVPRPFSPYSKVSYCVLVPIRYDKTPGDYYFLVEKIKVYL